MQIILSILFMSIFTFATANTNTEILQKLIIASSNTELSLNSVKSYVKENEIIQVLQKKYHFTVEMERLGDYNVTVIKPITSLSVRNTLFILLSPMFQDIFYIENLVDVPIPHYPSAQKEEGFRWIYYGIELQWIALFLLSFIGLILSLQSRRKISQLLNTQNMLKIEQEKMEREIKSLGGDNA